MVFVRKNLKVIKMEVSKDFEGISVGISARVALVNILFIYNPPIINNKDFLDFLENLIFTINTNDRFLIVGDLKMDPYMGDPRLQLG